MDQYQKSLFITHYVRRVGLREASAECVNRVEVGGTVLSLVVHVALPPLVFVPVFVPTPLLGQLFLVIPLLL